MECVRDCSAHPWASSLRAARSGASLRLRLAQEAIQRDGMTILDRFGQRKAHPLLPAERDARSQMLAALKALNLDVEPLHDRPGRPAGR